ncbi:MAG: 30S ribosomal protein S8e [Candidatus Nitrosopelagicus sp.]|jgi:small subunit ribosomal protein S8e|nr:30S ribosomal protein S8e [Candidatus Nitrosopelagicus sp.]|tara:strand:- start:356 stop:736 length:381 start_codon:yes stop_codon:yes gene_type:complete
MRKSVENLKTSKITGGIRHPLKSRRKFQMDRYPNEALMGEQLTVTRKTRGNNRKTAIKTANVVNVILADGKIKSSKIVRVLENQTNNDYQRRGVITKGAIVETEDGKCKILSRPGQDGTLNGTLLK